MIGESITGRQTFTRQLLAPVVGSAICYQLESLALSSGLQPDNSKLVTAMFVPFTLGLPAFRARDRAR